MGHADQDAQPLAGDLTDRLSPSTTTAAPSDPLHHSSHGAHDAAARFCRAAAPRSTRATSHGLSRQKLGRSWHRQVRSLPLEAPIWGVGGIRHIATAVPFRVAPAAGTRVPRRGGTRATVEHTTSTPAERPPGVPGGAAAAAPPRRAAPRPPPAPPPRAPRAPRPPPRGRPRDVRVRRPAPLPTARPRRPWCTPRGPTSASSTWPSCAPCGARPARRGGPQLRAAAAAGPHRHPARGGGAADRRRPHPAGAAAGDPRRPAGPAPLLRPARHARHRRTARSTGRWPDGCSPRWSCPTSTPGPTRSSACAMARLVRYEQQVSAAPPGPPADRRRLRRRRSRAGTVRGRRTWTTCWPERRRDPAPRHRGRGVTVGREGAAPRKAPPMTFPAAPGSPHPPHNRAAPGSGRPPGSARPRPRSSPRWSGPASSRGAPRLLVLLARRRQRGAVARPPSRPRSSRARRTSRCRPPRCCAPASSFDGPQLALAAASHSGEEFHRELSGDAARRPRPDRR